MTGLPKLAPNKREVYHGDNIAGIAGGHHRGDLQRLLRGPDEENAEMGMGVVWMSGYALYGASTTLLGEMGTTSGWIVFFAMTVLTGNVMGFMTGEWRSAPPKALRRMHAGTAVLVLAIIVVGLGGSLGA